MHTRKLIKRVGAITRLRVKLCRLEQAHLLVVTKGGNRDVSHPGEFANFEYASFFHSLFLLRSPYGKADIHRLGMFSSTHHKTAHAREKALFLFCLLQRLPKAGQFLL